MILSDHGRISYYSMRLLVIQLLVIRLLIIRLLVIIVVGGQLDIVEQYPSLTRERFPLRH
jgi:hypothetical protein